MINYNCAGGIIISNVCFSPFLCANCNENPENILAFFDRLAS